MVARLVFGFMTVLLINGWIDHSNLGIIPQANVQTGYQMSWDDFDNMYEWVAEELFDVEEALPEQEGDNDDAGKINPYKISLATIDLQEITFFFFAHSDLTKTIYSFKICKGFTGTLTPPPNV